MTPDVVPVAPDPVAAAVADPAGGRRPRPRPRCRARRGRPRRRGLSRRSRAAARSRSSSRGPAGSPSAWSSRPCCSSSFVGSAKPAVIHGPQNLGAMELIFPSDAVIVVAGVPGAGKTTLLRRAVDRAAARVVDTDDRPRRGPLLYPGHYVRIAAAIAGGRPAVIHSRGTLPIARRTIALLARLRGRPAHLVLLHADRATAEAGQRARGRTVAPRRDGPSGRPLAGPARRRRPDRRGLGLGHAARSRARPPTCSALRFVTAPALTSAAGVNGSSASRTQSGIGVLRQRLGVDEHLPQPALDQQFVAAPDLHLELQARGPEVRDHRARSRSRRRSARASGSGCSPRRRRRRSRRARPSRSSSPSRSRATAR